MRKLPLFGEKPREAESEAPARLAELALLP